MGDFLQKHSRTILLNEVNYEGQLNISKAKILLIGAGGLSSSIISLLSSAGVKKISIWEDDKLDLSNLQRQFIFNQQDVGKNKVYLAKKFINNLNHDVNVEVFNEQLNDSTLLAFKECAQNHDVIIDATDSFASRVLANKTAVLLQKPFFTGSAIGFTGHVYSFYSFEKNSPCYSCLFGDNYQNFKETKTCSNSGVFPPLPTIVGSLITQNVLQFIATQKCNFSKFILIDFNKANYFKEIKILKDKKCKICSNR